MASVSLHAIVLRRRDLGETDRIVTLLSQESGKLDAVAKGARKPGSKSSGASELFTLSHIQLAEGRRLGIVTQWLVLDAFTRIRAELGLLARASYLCELTDKLVDDGEPCGEVYDLLRGALSLLEIGHGHPDTVVHAYELRLLEERGYAPALGCCVRCGKEWKGSPAAFSPMAGGLLCRACRGGVEATVMVRPATIQTMHTLKSGELTELGAMEWKPGVAAEVEACLNGCVRVRCERDIRSARFLEMVRGTEV